MEVMQFYKYTHTLQIQRYHLRKIGSFDQSLYLNLVEILTQMMQKQA